MKLLLLVEEEDPITRDLSRDLENEGYTVEVCRSGRSAIDMINSSAYPVLILDRMLQDIDGIQVCESLREKGYQGYIILLANGETREDRIRGLKSGADDYMSKPFDFQELLARLETFRRREAHRDQSPQQRNITSGPLELFFDTHSVNYMGESISLTKREFELLHYLMENNGRTVSRSQILRTVWGYNFDPGTKLVEVYIRYLRKKLDREGDVSIIESLRGLGYRIRI